MERLPKIPVVTHKLSQLVQSLNPATRRFDADGIRYLVSKTKDYSMSYSTDIDDHAASENPQKSPKYVILKGNATIPVKVESRDGHHHRSPQAAVNQATFNQYMHWLELYNRAELFIDYSPTAINERQIEYRPRVRVGESTWGDGNHLNADRLALELFAVSGFNKPITRKPPLELYFYDRPVWELRPYGSGAQRTTIQQFHPNGLWGLQQELGKTITYSSESET